MSLKITTRTYISFVSTAIISIPLIYMVFRTINQTCISAAKNKLTNGKMIPICSIISLSSFSLMVICSFILFLAVIIMQEITILADRLISACWGLYAIGLWIMMFIYVLRIDFTFKSSKDLSILSYPKWLINLLYSCLAIIGILCFIIVIFLSIGLQSQKTTLYLSIITLILYIAFTIALICLFFRKLFVIMTKRLENNMTSITNDVNENENGVVIALDTLNNMVKYCLLVLQGVISTYIGNVLVVIALTDQTLPPYTFVAIDILVNSITLYFMFSFNSKQYKKCCSKCHVCCEQICISWVFSKYKGKLSFKERQQYETLILEETLR